MGKKHIKKTPKVSKLHLWFKHFTSESNPDTFLNQTAAAKAAGYKAKSDNSFAVIGYQNFRKLNNKIETWLDEVGLSESRLKKKLLSLMEAKETKFFQKDGVVTDQRDVYALETQRKTLDMALKVRGMYAPDRHIIEGDLAAYVYGYLDDKETD